ncbi:hypothetical protein IFM89_029212 [Coptis chinensis]|uniref:DNA repair protein REV1 n=1 Tax=Coptis chinensis TaxID=261450 RepID=A0A835ITH0_9MAGN|nr:hypothetical protein IFM89_029212 [Coptis chinensis]
MAWGSNSLPSSKSSSRKSNFSDFGSYMTEKNRKLREQFDTSTYSFHDSPLFNGVSIFVDGFTVPSSQELRSYMLKYGGRFENYFSRSQVTHIICSNLPDSKIKNIRSFSRGLPVVKPTWILDSVAANKLLNWVPYQLDQLVGETRKQPKLSAFFVPKTTSMLEDGNIPANCDEKLENVGPLPLGAISQEAPSCEVGESVDCSPECNEEISTFGQEKSGEVIKEESKYVDEEVSESKMAEPSSFDLNVGEALKCSPCKSSASATDCLGDQSKKICSTPRIGPGSNPCHSTLGDPNFVENYFKDCFFVSVILRNRPELQDKPVAVCHSDNPRGTAEISSANYPARDHGVKAGMFVRDAKALCPHLVIIPYNFEAYEVVADQFYDILHKYCSRVQAVSCDEAFLDVTDRVDEDAEHIASVIRQEIFEATGCTASAGVAGNMLMARLATQTAKPNGQFFISPMKVEGFLAELPIKALPGIGRVLEEKLKRLHIQTCGLLRTFSKESLQKDFGSKTGTMLWNYSRGIDSQPVGVVQETKSVGAEVNWGVRFNRWQDLKKKRKDAEEPAKYMGCGDCENLSHSVTIPVATDDVDVLQRISKQLFGYFQLDVKDIRGVGLQVSRLENADLASSGHERSSLRSWLSSASANMEEPISSSKERIDGEIPLLEGQHGTVSMKLAKPHYDGDSSKFVKNSTGPSYQVQTDQSRGDASLSRTSTLPHICDLDMGVIKTLPPEIFLEVNEMYGGKLSDLLEKNEDKDNKISDSVCNLFRRDLEGDYCERNKGKEPLSCHQVHFEKSGSKNEVHQRRPQEYHSASTSVAGSFNSHTTSMGEDQNDFMPTSLSQVDISVLQQLPEELKVDILQLLPGHRRPECSNNCLVECPHDKVKRENINDHLEESNSVSRNHLWIGCPPLWVDKFEVSNHLILNLLAEMYYRSGSSGLLSSLLQSTISAPPTFWEASNDPEDDVISSVCSLLQQYIELKIKSDMEEIYICFRLLRRWISFILAPIFGLKSDVLETMTRLSLACEWECTDSDILDEPYFKEGRSSSLCVNDQKATSAILNSHGSWARSGACWPWELFGVNVDFMLRMRHLICNCFHPKQVSQVQNHRFSVLHEDPKKAAWLEVTMHMFLLIESSVLTDRATRRHDLIGNH